jgi:hypothetical protein
MWMKNVPLFLICCLLCAAMLYAGQRAKSKGKKFHRYALVLENFGTAPICDIAAAMGLSYEEAQADLSAMIDKGYIEKAYIDQKTKRFVFVGGKQTAKETAGRQKRVVCEGCGAAAVVNIGRHSLCDYCNSPLDTT